MEGTPCRQCKQGLVVDDLVEGGINETFAIRVGHEGVGNCAAIPMRGRGRAEHLLAA